MSHNNQWLCTSFSHIGRVRDAIAVARNLVEQPRDPQKNGPNDGGSAQRSGRARWAELLTRYELWDDLITATQLRRSRLVQYPFRAGAEGIYPGVGIRRQERPGQARRADRGAEEIIWCEAKTLLAELEGLELLAQGEIGPAFEQFAKATSMRPEALARHHLAARNYGFAESTARQAVEKNPKQVPALAAQVEVLHAAGKEKEAP